MKTVSVHIVTYNSSEQIDDCLEAVLRQSHPIEQIVVIDNASKDNTIEKLEKWSEKCSIIKNSMNNGFAGGHNQAIWMTETDYCLILNPDVVLEPDYVLNTIKSLNNHTQAGSATGKLLFKADSSHSDSTGLVINKARRAFDRGADQPSDQFVHAEEVFGVSGAAAMYAREMINDISLNGEFFDEDFFAYKEDVDVAWRAQLLGWKAYYEPTAIAYHERGWKEGGRSSKPLFVRRLSYINRYKMMVKNDRISMMLKHIIPLLVYECLSFAYALLREPKLLGAWSSFFHTYKDLRQKRGMIRSKQKLEATEINRWFGK
ncbi:glycosyltransferase family 2 protein [Paenibacillus frigoriresistens]|uniref:glycosyltransferase family 2 protein n=1 Tax=Paenibacillus alginolyticus TaxID=59839 RepID=UPI0015646D00|nr:glycosyltransferase family 2 protein [Paenibacillus frigoriresistens]NRF96234.1 glycosyltransferase family 2 protein [Paenibacillus frigoriresistens]